MTDTRTRKISLMASVAYGAAALIFVISIVKSPGDAFRASLAGLQIWWQTVFPGLLPPLMLTELLAASGLLHGFAALGEPLMRRLFRLPGAAGWAVALGWSAGLPAGARETGRLREKSLIHERDADTLLLVSHAPNPFLVIIVVGSGFLQAPVYGWAIALGLWLSALCAGAIWSRLIKRNEPAGPMKQDLTQTASRLRIAGRAIRQARAEETRPFGKQIADAVTHVVTVLFAIGGLIMMSAVLIRMLQLFFPGTDTWLTVPGLYEMHLGAYETGRSALFEASPAHAAALLAGILAWSGLSGLLQARAAYGTATPFPWRSFVAGRLFHAALAIAFTYPLALLTQQRWLTPLAPAWLGLGGGSLAPSTSSDSPLPSGWTLLPETLLATLACLAIFALLSLLAILIRPGRRKPKGPGS